MEPTPMEFAVFYQQILNQLEEHCKKKRGRMKKLCDALGFDSPDYIYPWLRKSKNPQGDTFYRMVIYLGFDPKFILFVFAMMLKEKEEKEERE